MSKLKSYDGAYKLEVCRRIVDKGESSQQVARELGISKNTVYSWTQQYKASGIHSFPGSGYLRLKDDGIRKLQRENRELREENEILKKAAVYFAKNQK